MKYPLHTILDVQNRYVRKRYQNYKFVNFNENELPLTYTQTLNLHINASKFSREWFVSSSKKSHNTPINWITLYDVSFLRKEKIYTKLKYSRCPQYDIISGGFAAIFAGFIGFLISEKFGIELVDSGDFYLALMYGIFSVCSIRPLLRVYSVTATPYTPYSLKYGVLFWLDCSTLALNRCKQTFSKLFR